MADDGFVWTPDEVTAGASRLRAFLDMHDLSGFDALGDLAVRDPERFYDALIRFFDIGFSVPYERILDSSAGKEWPRWCIGGRTNLATNCLDRQLEAGRGGREAIVWEGEDGEVRRWTYSDLARETALLADGLRSLGLGKGDIVAIYMPMLPETAAAFLAVARIGAVALPLFSGFGPAAVANRLNDAAAVAVLTVDGTLRRGAVVEMKTALDRAAQDVPTLRHVVVLNCLGIGPPGRRAGRDHDWHGLVSAASEAPVVEMAAEDPLMLIYTSGTTGRPKGTVHTHCGALVKNALDLGLLLDIGGGDRLLWMSDMGWLVGPKTVIGATLLGATLILAEGAPDYPDAGRLWRLAAEHGATVVGLTPTVARAYMARSPEVVDAHDLRSLRILVSTGELWDRESWSWLFHRIGGGKTPILNYAGGTEVGGAILIGTLLHPLRPCSFGGPVPGTAAGAVDDKGDPAAVGAKGELVMRQPSIGLTRGLWNDPTRFIETYWSRYPGCWAQGDLASIDDKGLWYLHGRADDTIKVAGKRTGPGEIEQLLLASGRVSEAAAVGVPHPVKGEVIVCVCVPRTTGEPDREIADLLCDAVADGLGNPFRPQDIVFVEDLPRTRNQKIMRRVVRALYVGEDPGDLQSLANPGVLAMIETALRSR